jgi:HSP20 family protein
MLTVWRPLEDFARLASHAWYDDPASTWSGSGSFSPKVDVRERGDAYSIDVDLPGVDPTEVKVTLENNVLSISGERKREHEEKTARHCRYERSYGSFCRSFELPSDVAGDKLTATCKNGVLTVVAPKKAEAHRAISVQVSA